MHVYEGLDVSRPGSRILSTDLRRHESSCILEHINCYTHVCALTCIHACVLQNPQQSSAIVGSTKSWCFENAVFLWCRWTAG